MKEGVAVKAQDPPILSGVVPPSFDLEYRQLVAAAILREIQVAPAHDERSTSNRPSTLDD